MTKRRFAGVFAAIFLLGALPLVLAQPSGLASAGLSAGFVSPLSSLLQSLFMLFLGAGSVYMGRLSAIVIPAIFLLFLLIGSLLTLAHTLPYSHSLLLLGIMLFGYLASIIEDKKILIVAFFAASFAYHLGVHFMDGVPAVASPLYYLLGMMVGVTLLLGSGVSLGIAGLGVVEKYWAKVKISPSIASFFSFF